ncbi:MarR family winged helix-turn-helix transcriptional regulator [Ferrovibrio xuzhouensis]|uniref:MarR family winged helix-turn-helix transcriptional regulator n=1 Tax=Ferrovibrio xuzhouensis TaxID=1576914 RepID=A0ABV7VDD5_9PROT
MRNRVAGEVADASLVDASPAGAVASGRRDDLGVLPGLVGYNLRRTQEAVFGAFMEMVTGKLDSAGLTPGQFGVLAIVVANPGLKQIELGTALGVDRSTIVAAVDKLENRGLVERRPVPHDRRAHALTLTAEGQRVYRRALTLVDRHEAKIAGGLTPAERSQLLDLLGRVQRAAQQRP